VKVGTEDGKLRLVTQSEVRRVRRRIGDPVTSPGANGRSRRVAADPGEGFNTQVAPSPVTGPVAAAASASLQASRSRPQQTVSSVPELLSNAGIGQTAGPLPAAAGAGTGGSFSEQLNAALRAAHTADVPPAWVPMLRAPTETRLLMGQQINTSGPNATALAAISDAETDPQHPNGITLPHLLHSVAPGVAARVVPQRQKGSRSRQSAATRQQEGQLPSGTTNRGRVRQRGSKRADLLRVGKLR